MGELFNCRKNKQNHYLKLNKELFFWRLYGGTEINLIESTTNSINTYELKWGNKAPKVTLAFVNKYPNANFSVVNKKNYLEFILAKE